MRRWTSLNPIVVILLWAIGVCGAFWQFEAKDLRPATRPEGAADIQSESLPLCPVASFQVDGDTLPLRGGGVITLINVWNPHCPCSRFNEAHTAQLAQKFRDFPVRFLTLIECGHSQAEQNEAVKLWQERGQPDYRAVPDPDGALARKFGVWAAPAAVILDQHGRVAYIGAYNTARFCTKRQTAWAWQALDALLKGQRPLLAKSPFYGCQVQSQPTPQSSPRL